MRKTYDPRSSGLHKRIKSERIFCMWQIAMSFMCIFTSTRSRLGLAFFWFSCTQTRDMAMNKTQYTYT